MHWRYKALVQGILSVVPFGEQGNYFLQRFVTKNLPNTDQKFTEILDHAEELFSLAQDHLPRPLPQASFYEFGAGVTLTIPLAHYGLGVERQILVDLRRLARFHLINDTIRKFQRLPARPGFRRRVEQLLTEGSPKKWIQELRSCYGIDYRAPCDARGTGLPASSIDCITSTNTLEHIPADDIARIFAECHRILRDDGVLAFRIDYQDHYSYFDSSISVYHFLQFPESRWRWSNPSLHFQNRLRHRDYLELLTSHGFTIVAQKRNEGNLEDYAKIRELVLDARFHNYSVEELAVRGAIIVARKQRRAG